MTDELVPEWLTPTWLSEVMQADVSGFQWQRIGDGLVGMNLRLVLDVVPGQGVPGRLVVKLPSPDPTSRATGVALRNYEREVCFYRDLAATVDIRVAHCHRADWDAATGDFVLVLEDLAPAAQGNQLTGCTVAQARTAVLELARLHGPRWGDPSLDGLEWLSRHTGADDTQRLVMLWGMFLPGFMATYGPALTADQRGLIEAFGQRLGDWIDGSAGPLTVTHGDYRLDNLMFATPEGGPAVAAVDWQTPGHGIAMGDVAYFLGAGLVPDDRRTVERGLVSEYLVGLDAYGVQLREPDAWEQYRRASFGGVVMSVIASQIVGASDRSQQLFTAMATRHAQHALDLDALATV